MKLGKHKKRRGEQKMKQARNLVKRKNGITLIALVVTIIVLIILAGVSINMVIGENGILTRASDASKQTEEAKEEELRRLTTLEAATYIEEHKYEDPSGETITIPAQCAVSQVEGENTLENGLVIIDFNGNEYVWIEVPKNDTVYQSAGINVEAFTDENYNKIYNDLKSYAFDYNKNRTNWGWSDTWYNECGIDSESEYNNKKKKMLKSIYENEGFWIGRYEIGSNEYILEYTENDKRVPICKKNAYPYNFITCGQAQKLADTFSSGNYTSSLMFGVQWDLVCKYIEENGKISVEKINKNSSTWGNFLESEFQVNNGFYLLGEQLSKGWNTISSTYLKLKDTKSLLTTGATERNKILNIYDFAGNVSEWTLEYSKDTTNNINNMCVNRGGNINYSTNAAYPGASASNYYSYGVGFRLALY